MMRRAIKTVLAAMLVVVFSACSMTRTESPKTMADVVRPVKNAPVKMIRSSERAPMKSILRIVWET